MVKVARYRPCYSGKQWGSSGNRTLVGHDNGSSGGLLLHCSTKESNLPSMILLSVRWHSHGSHACESRIAQEPHVGQVYPIGYYSGSFTGFRNLLISKLVKLSQRTLAKTNKDCVFFHFFLAIAEIVEEKMGSKAREINCFELYRYNGFYLFYLCNIAGRESEWKRRKKPDTKYNSNNFSLADSSWESKSEK